jgi:CRP/FNR family cyclic AMP-dependent transcriptional regulator
MRLDRAKLIGAAMTGILDAENWISEAPPHVRQAILERMATIDLAAGAVIKNAGDPPEGLFQIESGFVQLLGLHNDGRQILILIYRPGNTFGETPMVARRAFNHTTVALTPVRIRKLPQAAFWDLYHRHPEIPEALCRKFATNTSRTFAWREFRATHRLKTQIALMLVNIAEYCGKPEPGGGVSVELPITQADIAAHLEVTRQAVQREIGAMKAAGLLYKRDSRWHLASLEAMRLL